MIKLIAKIYATFFGVGYFPIAPGTAASFIIVILYKLFLYKLSWPLYLTVALFIYITGVVASSRYSSDLKIEDPRSVVIDEVLGQLLAVFLLEPTWALMIAGFLLFRLFDVLKPFLIKKAEKFSQGWGIMLDDIVAGLYSAIIINLYLLIK
jgi:phosphatidylglycerophosphatase A